MRHALAVDRFRRLRAISHSIRLSDVSSASGYFANGRSPSPLASAVSPVSSCGSGVQRATGGGDAELFLLLIVSSPGSFLFVPFYTLFL